MMEYRLGDVFIFFPIDRSEWLLVEIGEKTYKFVNLWSPEQIWISQKKAPIHKCGPIKHYRGGVILH